MKILLLSLLISCTTTKSITPKISRVVNNGNHYKAYIWHRDSWLVATFKELPDSIRKGRRITLMPGDTTFQRVGRQTRPW